MTQPTLFRLPRELERGEPVRCGACGECDHWGSMGPPGMIEGAWSQRREEVWHCEACGAAAWRRHLENRGKIETRRRRLAMFKACQREGLQGSALFVEAEKRLREIE